jgi:hypothetical protein
VETRAAGLDEDSTEFEIAKFMYSSRPCSNARVGALFSGEATFVKQLRTWCMKDNIQKSPIAPRSAGECRCFWWGRPGVA